MSKDGEETKAPEGETQPQTLEDAMGISMAEAAPKEEEKVDNPEAEAKGENTEETASEETPSSGEEDDSPPQADLSGVEEWPSDMREEYDKRIKGYQAAWTKGRQKDASEVSDLRKEYEEKFQEALGQLRGQAPQQAAPAQKSTLQDFYPDADPAQLEMFEKALTGMVEAKLKPLQDENQTLRQAYAADKQAGSIQSEWDALAGKHALKDDYQNDMVAFAQANPTSVKGQSLENIYKLMTWDSQQKAGRQSAMAEMKRKEQESLENNSSINTVEKEEPKSIAESFALAEKQHATKPE